DQARLSSAFATSDLTIIRLASIGEKLSQKNVAEVAHSLVNNMGDIVRDLVDQRKPNVLVVIGGDTFTGVSKACEISTIRLEDELQPGTTFGVVESGLLSDTRVVTRAGGFGNKESITDLVRRLNSSFVQTSGETRVEELDDE
ncbi:MAG: nucleotide-binding domain containing protein, partial [Chloroflexota bacterium]